jgi:hypothetical protein
LSIHTSTNLPEIFFSQHPLHSVLEGKNSTGINSRKLPAAHSSSSMVRTQRSCFHGSFRSVSQPLGQIYRGEEDFVEPSREEKNGKLSRLGSR